MYGTPLSTPIHMKWDGQEHRRDTKEHKKELMVENVRLTQPEQTCLLPMV